MSPKREKVTPGRDSVTPGCCDLGDANLEWFPASPPEGAWHPSSFRWDARVDVPISQRLKRCPFCGRKLGVPSD